MKHPVRWPGFVGGGLLLPLPPTWFSPPATVLPFRGATFRVKHEFHITVLNRSVGAQVRDTLSESQLRRLFEAEDWSPSRAGDGVVLRRQVRVGGRKETSMSIVELVDLPALGRFRERLAQASGIELPRMPPHVTLMTAGDGDGIGLPSLQALAEREVVRFRIPGIAPRPPPVLDPALLAAYEATEYAIDAMTEVVRIGARSVAVDRELARLGASRACIVTAANPYSEPSDESANVLRQLWLSAELQGRGVQAMQAVGRDPSGHWPPEDSLLVPGSTSQLEAQLMRDYEQHAVVVLEPGQPARIALHPDA